MDSNALRFHTFGKPEEVVQLEQISLPDLALGEIRVALKASPVNPADINYVQGNYGVKPELPNIPGIEGHGVVTESASDEFNEGDHVIFIERVGTWQTLITCAANRAIKIPNNLDPLQAAMLKVNPLTAWQLIHKFTQLNKGDWIVQNAANSGVGQCVIQIAKLLGLKTINLVRREEPIALLAELGGDVNLLDNNESKEEILKLTGGALPRVAFNAVGGDSALRLMDILDDQGHHITFGAMSMRSLKVPNKFLIFKRITLHGLWITKCISESPREEIKETYQKLATWVADGKLKQAVAATYSLDKLTEALTHAQTSQRDGKVLFEVS